MSDHFETQGELIYCMADTGDGILESLLKRAVAGRIVRCLRQFSNEPLEALAEASTNRGCLIRGAALEAVPHGSFGGYLASIRREDRERFEETVHGSGARWIGETRLIPGLLKTGSGD